MSVTSTIATTAVVGIAAGTAGYAGYFKGYLDSTEHHQKYLETERSWRLIWDKQIVFLRQLIVGKFRSTGNDYTDAYVTRLLSNVDEMKISLTMVFPSDKVMVFTSQLILYIQSINSILTSNVSNHIQPITADQTAQLRTIDTAMASALNSIDCKLFRDVESKILLSEFTLRMLRMCDAEGSGDIAASMVAYGSLQSFAANMANYFAKAISITRFPIRKWI